ncbi:MAG TPA: flagellar hook-basal body complex protein FliE [Candidatus Bathyarchaeia archaeon]|nr:flagellar hook-basal body complex protein FliE [Candidatus Bathyarchaeia archaeon]
MDVKSLAPIGKLAFTQQPQPVTATPAEVTKSFANFLTDAIDEVNKAQVESANLTKMFAAGKVEDVHQVMIASQKSTIMLQTALQVRNKVIESYQEIMRMSI